MYKLLPTLILLGCCLISPKYLTAQQSEQLIEVPFYSENILLRYHPSIILEGLFIPDELTIDQYYQQMESTPYQPLIDQLQGYQKDLQLNDWLYYMLLKQTIAFIYAREGPHKRDASLWYFLTKSGFDTRISYSDNSLNIYVWSEEDIYETPMISDEDRRYINLSRINQAGESNSSTPIKLLLHKAELGASRSFSFSLRQLPKLSPNIVKRKLDFRVKERSFKMEIKVDRTIHDVMKHYPLLAEQAYFEVPMSTVSYESLLPKLQFMVQDKSKLEALQILVSFTRSAFEYKDDQEFFGRSRPMIAEELFHYAYSDCEDRAALFYYLVKEILNLPMLIIAYPDHLSIAVAAEELTGIPIEYEGKSYFICDPTGPKESYQIGRPPAGYESAAFEIIGF